MYSPEREREREKGMSCHDSLFLRRDGMGCPCKGSILDTDCWVRILAWRDLDKNQWEIEREGWAWCNHSMELEIIDTLKPGLSHPCYMFIFNKNNSMNSPIFFYYFFLFSFWMLWWRMGLISTIFYYYYFVYNFIILEKPMWHI